MWTEKLANLRVKRAFCLALLSLLALPAVNWGAGNLLGKTITELEPVDLVDPFIGTDAHGHTYPGATIPFGMVQLGPDTRTDTWDGCSGYHWSDNSILGFSHTHLSGTGCADLGDILVNPITDQINTERGFNYKDFKHSFEHKNENASPGYYSVILNSSEKHEAASGKGSIKAELTATKRVGFHRYSFDESTKTAKLIIDLGHGISDETLDSALKIVDDRTVTGIRHSKGWAKNQYVYFAASFSKPFKTYSTARNHESPRSGVNAADGKEVAALLDFDNSDGKALLAKVALSSVSAESAQNNISVEIPGWDFESVKTEARKSWKAELDKIRVYGVDKNRAKTFYTALYHSLLAPVIVSDADGSFRGSDFAVHKANDFENYSTFSLWDTFRAEHALLTIIEADRVNDLIKSLLVHGKFHKDKTLPIWTLASNETYCMIGYHSFPVIAEAYLKGFRSYDINEIFKLMLANTRRNDSWAKRGYIAADQEYESVSKTLEFAYDDWCLAELAKALGKKDEAEKFYSRSKFYKNVFDSKSGFMRGRLADGSWRVPFDPSRVVGDVKLRDFTEANPWQYAFFVPHDVEKMIELYGGRSKFVNKLDQMFATALTGKIEFNDVSGLIGQYAQGNEPSHHVAYLYSYAGSPDKTAERVKQIRDTLYDSSPAGLCGNEDCGQMSAWYVFSALGFYPVNPVQCNYVIGTPMFEKAVLNLAGGKTFTVSAPGLSKDNIYIEKAVLNGKPLNRVYISHKELTAGGKLDLYMTNKAGKWGTAKTAAPPN